MYFTKKYLVFAAVALAIAVVSVSAANLKLGKRQPGDILACHMDVKVPAKPDGFVRYQRICYLPTINHRINMIEVTDLDPLGKGGNVRIVRGGLYQRHVSLYIGSEMGQALNLTVNIFAHT